MTPNTTNSITKPTSVSLLLVLTLALSACVAPGPTPALPTVGPGPLPLTQASAAPAPTKRAPPTRLPTATVPPIRTPLSTGLPPLVAFPLPANLYFIAPDANGEARVWLLPRQGGPPSELTPPGQPISDFAVAPDGRTLAFRTGQMIIVSNSSGGVLLDDQAPMPDPGAPADSIAWSPDGTRLAYSLGSALRLHIVGRDNGPDLSVGLTGAQIGRLGWSPDSRWLAALAAPAISGAKAQLVLVDSQAEKLEPIVLKQYYDYLWLDDGTLWGTMAERRRDRFVAGPTPQVMPLQNQPLIGIASPRDDGRVAYMDFGLAPTDDFGVLSSMAADGSDPRVEGTVSILIKGTIWAPGGRRLLVHVPNEGLRLSDPQSGANALLPGTEKATIARWGPLPLPEVHDASGLTLPADLYFLAGGPTTPAQVWRLPRSGAPIQWTKEPGSVVDFAISPDGTQLAYTTGRELVVARVGGADRRVLATLSGQDPYRPIQGQPAWSPDSKQIAYVQDGIWAVAAEGGQPRQLIADQRPQNEVETVLYMRPTWSPDAKWLLAWEQHWEGNAWALIPAAGSRAVSLPDSAVPEAHWTPDNRVLLASAGGAYTAPGLRLVTPGDPPQLAPVLGQQWLVQAPLLRGDGRIAFLAAPGISNLLVPVVRPYSATLDGSDVRAEGNRSYILSAPIAWSPDGQVLASVDPANGALVLTLLATGQQIQLAEPQHITQVMWGK